MLVFRGYYLGVWFLVGRVRIFGVLRRVLVEVGV